MVKRADLQFLLAVASIDQCIQQYCLPNEIQSSIPNLRLREVEGKHFSNFDILMLSFEKATMQSLEIEETPCKTLRLAFSVSMEDLGL